MNSDKRREHWTNHVKNLEASGLSAKAYATLHKISHTSLCEWRRLLSGQNDRFSEVIIKDQMPIQSKFTIDLNSLDKVTLCLLLSGLVVKDHERL